MFAARRRCGRARAGAAVGCGKETVVGRKENGVTDLHVSLEEEQL